VGAVARFHREHDGTQPGDPRKAAAVILHIASLEEPPLRLLLGSDAVHLAGTFCPLPAYSQFNRALRRAQPDLAALLVYTAQTAQSQAAYEILDSYGVRTRRLGRRGDGWLALVGCKGKCTRRGWFYGCKVFDAVTPNGTITGLGLAPATVQEQPCTETLLWARQQQPPQLNSLGKPCAAGIYLADRGFNGVERHLH